MIPDDPLLRLLSRFRDEGVEYVLVGGQAVRLNGFLRATEDIDVLLRPTLLKTDYREKDLLDKQVLTRIKRQISEP